MQKSELIYPELSYILVGCAFEVYNEMGSGHAEKFYQRAYATLLEKKNIQYEEQSYSPLIFQGKIIGRSFFDFLVEDKIVVEIKKANYFSKANIDQVFQYLLNRNLKLGLLINFGNNGVYSKRVVNLEQRQL